jgi:hypothetical protein
MHQKKEREGTSNQRTSIHKFHTQVLELQRK